MEFLKGIEPRKYQQKIFETCTKKNCLVVLPTGLGKTLIALMLTIERMKKFPGEKVLFLAPTKPLAEQHLASFEKHLSELFADMQIFTGSVNSKKRKEIFKTADIIFSTPQCIANDLKKEYYKLDKVCLLIEDEAHRCVKNYDYNYVAQRYKSQRDKNERLIGLTASPGSKKEKIQQICKNLFIEEVELRTRESVDVINYLQELEFQKEFVEFPTKFLEIKKILEKIYYNYIDELKTRRVLYGPVNKVALIKLQQRLMQGLKRGSKNWNEMLAVSSCAQSIKISHAIDLIETQTLNSVNIYLKKLFKEAAQKKSKGVIKLTSKPEFNLAYSMTCELLAKKIEHPKLKRVYEIITEELENNESIKIIIFTQFRDTAQSISKKINEIKKIKSEIFVGQTKKGETGLSQKDQKRIIEEFKKGEINVLVATSLHPNEYIVLKKDEKILIKPIGEFVEQFIENKEKKQISKKISGWKVLSTDGKKTLFKPITNVHRHISKNNLSEITLKSGFDCKITKDHSLFSFDKNKEFISSPPKVNKFVASAYNCPNFENNKQIDVIKEIKKNCDKKELEKLFGSVTNVNQSKIRKMKTDQKILSLLKSKKLNITELSKKSKKDYSTVMNCLNRLKKEGIIKQIRKKKNYKKISMITKKGKEHLKSLNWYFENIQYHKGKYRFKLFQDTKSPKNEIFSQNVGVNYGKIPFPRYLEINEELAKFLGFYVSEGHARKTKKTSNIFLAAIVKKMKKDMVKSIEQGLKLKPRLTSKGVSIDSQITYFLIKDVFKAGIGSYNKEVPEIIFTAPNNTKWAFLEAYFLGEGHLKKNKEYIVLTTVSRKLVTGIVLLLRMLGIKKITLKKQKHIYRINIHESLPFAKLKEKNINYERKNYYSLIPTAMKYEKAFNMYKNYFWDKKRKYIGSRKKGKWENDISYDYIKKIKDMKNSKFVYDISVKDTENFIGGAGLFCFHNSIAEEGLDIPEVNAVIFYEPIPSAIRTIQRRGRTARLTKGKLIMLITKGTKDEAYYYVSKAREKKMYSVIEDIKRDFQNTASKTIQKNL